VAIEADTNVPAATTVTLTAPAASGTIVTGATGAVDNTMVVADGTSGTATPKVKIPTEGDTQFGTSGAIVQQIGQADKTFDIGNNTTPKRCRDVNCGRQINLSGGSASLAPMNVTASAAPTSPVDGDVWHDSTRKTLQAFVSGVKTNLGGLLFQSTASITHANSVTETSLIGSGVGTMTLPSAILVAGKKLRFHASGTITCDAVTPGTLTFTLYHATSVSSIAVVNTPPLLGAGTARKWSFDLELTIRSATTMIGNGRIIIHTSATDAVLWEFGSGSATVAIAAGLVDFKADWQTADADNSIICTDFSMEVLG
jgi:hypothetical protein